MRRLSTALGIIWSVGCVDYTIKGKEAAPPEPAISVDPPAVAFGAVEEELLRAFGAEED